ncbi:MAG: hypothetical protein WC139_13855 [Candidatus Kapaibacterium sp.]
MKQPFIAKLQPCTAFRQFEVCIFSASSQPDFYFKYGTLKIDLRTAVMLFLYFRFVILNAILTSI